MAPFPPREVFVPFPIFTSNFTTGGISAPCAGPMFNSRDVAICNRDKVMVDYHNAHGSIVGIDIAAIFVETTGVDSGRSAPYPGYVTIAHVDHIAGAA